MTWKGVDLNPLEWGFLMKDNCMLPLMSDTDACPKVIIDKIKCGCKTGCTRKCSCKILGIECTLNCKNYIENCSNKTYNVEDVD